MRGEENAVSISRRNSRYQSGNPPRIFIRLPNQRAVFVWSNPMKIGAPITTPDGQHGKIERTSTETGALLVRITDQFGHQGWFVASECRVG